MYFFERAVYSEALIRSAKTAVAGGLHLLNAF
jgi:hypothetical protein